MSRNFIDNETKLKAIAQVDAQQSKHAIALEHGVDPSRIRKWVHNRVAILKTNKKKKTVHKGPAYQDRVHIPELLKYVESTRNEDLGLNHGIVTQELMRYKDIESLEKKPYKNSIQRVRRILKSNRWIIRRGTRVAQNTRYFVHVANQWRSYVNDHIRENEIAIDCVVNGDETPIGFDVSPKSTIARKGERTVRIKKSTATQKATVFLAVARDGTKLPPFIIFKGKPNGRIAKKDFKDYPAGAVYICQDSNWMDEQAMLKWVELVWVPFTKGKSSPCYLIVDDFSAHKTSAVRSAISECGSSYDIVEPGYTGKLQVCDVGINKPFKDKYNELFLSFRFNHPKLKPNRPLVSQWIITAWGQVTTDCITNTWDKVLTLEHGPHLLVDLPSVPDEDNVDSVSLESGGDALPVEGSDALSVEENESNDENGWFSILDNWLS